MFLSTFWKASILLTIIGLAYSGLNFSKYLASVEKAKTDIVDLKQRLSDMQTYRDARKTDWDAYETQQARTAQVIAKPAALKKRKENLETDIEAQKAEFKGLASSVREAVDKVRANASSMTIHELKLTDGRVWTEARIRKIEEDQLSFTHSGGIGVLQISQLPPETLERLDMGPANIARSITLEETDIFSGVTRAAGVTLKSPIPLIEKPYQVNLPVVAEARQFHGKMADEMEVSVACIRYVKGTVIDLDAAVAGTIKSVSALEGMSDPRQQVRDVTVGTVPSKRSSFSAKRYGGEMFAEYLHIYNGDKFWMIQVIFTNKLKGASSIAENVLKSVQIDPTP